MPTPKPSLIALIKLLADDHTEVVEAARAKLVELGSEAVPFLEETLTSHEDPKVRVEVQAVLDRIRLEGVLREWEKASAQPDETLDLEEGVFLLARVRYPSLQVEPYRRQLDEMAHQIRPLLRAAARPKERLLMVSQFLFEGKGFRGNWDDYSDPENSYLNRVLDRKLGIPISLSVIYLLIARRLQLPVYGVGIPGRFMVKYSDSRSEFYIDPFNGGLFLSRAECVQFMVEAGYPYQMEFLRQIRVRDVLARMIRNLILIYVDRKEEGMEKTLSRCLDVLYADRRDGPDRGVLYD